jgi:aryl-alcohol dehydrogenase
MLPVGGKTHSSVRGCCGDAAEQAHTWQLDEECTLMRITAAVLRACDAPYRIEDVELRDPGPGEVRVRIVAVGMCHTDVLPRVSGFLASPPIITGHEASGVVDAVGETVTDLIASDHVVISFDSCRVCANCQSGHPAYCESFVTRNLTGVGVEGSGAVRDTAGMPIASRWFGQSSFASHAIAAARNIVKVDPTIPLELLGPLGCGVLTGAGSILVALGVDKGSSVAVFGAGSVGLSAVMAARVAGAATIVAVDRNRDRLQLAGELGATHTFDANAPDLESELTRVTGGGPRYALDTTGVPSVIQTAVRVLRPTGICGLVAAKQGDVVLDPNILAFGRTVTGILEGDAIPAVLIPQLIQLWRQGRFPFDKLITTFPLQDINEAERASIDGAVVKPVLIV